MKLNIYFALILCFMLVISSCYKDKSKFADTPIGEVIIDTTGFNQKQYVGYMEELHLDPSIYFSDGSSVEYLQYKWELSFLATDYNTEFETISTKKELNYTVTRLISVAPYLLKLTVTDNKNSNLQYFCYWEVYVQSSFIDGLLIADTKDGLASDFTYIKNSALTLNYYKEEAIFREILKKGYDKPYLGLFKNLTYEVYGYPDFGSHTNQVWAVTEDGDACRFNCENFTITGTLKDNDESIIIYKPDNFKVKSFFPSSQLFFANTSLGFYNFIRTNGVAYTLPDPITKGCIPNNDIVATNSNRNVTDNHTVWYDKVKGKFLSYSGIANFGSAELVSYNSNAYFDPNNIPGKSSVAAISSEEAKVVTFLLKDDLTGEYNIYLLNQAVQAQSEWDPEKQIYVEKIPAQPATAGRKIIISSEGKNLLDEAVSVFFAQNANVLYIATPNAIYTISYGATDVATVTGGAKFSTQVNEIITKAKIYQQGHYTNDMSVLYQGSVIGTIPWNNKAVIIATQTSSSEGKVYVIPIAQIGTGVLDTSKALSYGGFGKVLDVIAIGY